MSESHAISGAPAAGRSEADRRMDRAYGRGLLRRFLDWAFGPVRLPEDLGRHLQELESRGTVVYVGRSASFVAFLFFQQLAVRLGAPVAQAVVGLQTQPRRWFMRLFAGRRAWRAPAGEALVESVERDQPGLVFLRRPGTWMASVLGIRDPFPALVKLQRQRNTPIFLVPQLLMWARRPAGVEKSLWEILFGDPEAPGLWRSLFSVVRNRHHAYVHVGEAIDLQKFLADHDSLDDAAMARRVRGTLQQHLAREARVVTGPRQKAPYRLMAETLRDRTLRSTLAEVARERGRADGSVDKEARRDLKELAATYSPLTVEVASFFLTYVFDRIYDGLDIDEEGLERVRRASAQMPIVVCPSHKSHVDYLAMSHIFFKKGLFPPHIAAGINLNFWPVGRFFRNCGAFFIRRSFKGDKVYGAVLKAYIRKLVKDGYSQEFFVEGGRSRTGKVLLPKFGMLAMEVDAWIDGARPDIGFVPSWIGYAQIIEAGSYARELGGGEKKAENLGSLLSTPKILISRYGRVYIRFDNPISLAQLAQQRGFDRLNHTDEEKRSLVRALGFRIVDGINRATVLTPTGLLCTVLLSHDSRGLSSAELVDRMQFLLKLAVAFGGRLSFTPSDEALDPMGSGPLGEARASLERQKQLVVHRAAGEPIFQVPDEARITLDYQKNTAIHFYVPDALLATGLLTSPDRSRSAVRERTLALSRLLKQEFIYAAGAFDDLFTQRIARFVEWGLLEADGDQLVPTAQGNSRLALLAAMVVPFVEGYVAAAEALELLANGPADAKAFVASAMERSRAAFLAGRLRRAESRSKVMLENALALFEEQGLVVRAGDKGRQRSLGPGWSTPEARAAKVAEIRRFLVDKAP